MDNTTMVVSDKKGNNDLKFTFDWDKRKEETVVHAKMGDITAVLDKDGLWKAVFALVNEDKQELLVPSKTQTTRHFTKQVRIKATKNVKKGEQLVFSITYSLPEDELRRMYANENKAGIIVQ